MSADQFVGRWIGETQGEALPAHEWEISAYDDTLFIMTRWEGDRGYGQFQAEILPGESAFRILGVDFEAVARLVDRQHFVIAGWVWPTRTNPDGTSASLDVVFSRPGLAELTAQAAYLKHLAAPK
jgi:hypothetical protein